MEINYMDIIMGILDFMKDIVLLIKYEI
jgi:hypothetical protein